jgi:peptide/nickel transport system substrate-binding protein
MLKKRQLSKLAVLGAAVAAAALTLAACGSSGTTTTTTSTSQSAKTVKVPGGTLTIAEAPSDGPNYIFPMMGGAYASVSDFEMVYTLFRPLYWFGVGNTPLINAGVSLADLPVYSNGGKTVTIRMKDYKWSNGQPVDAQDVLFWMNMLKADATSWAVYAPGPGQFPGDVTNVVADNATNTVTITANNAYSTYWFTDNELSQITPLPIAWDITSPAAAPGSGGCSSAPYQSVTTTMGSTGVVPVSAAAKACAAVFAFLSGPTEAGDLATYATNPLWQIVDGPYKLSAYDATNNGMTWVKNTTFSGPVKPSLDKIILAPFTTDESEYSVLESGGLDIGYVPPEDLPTYHGPAFSSDGAPLAGPNAPSLAANYNLDPSYPWGVNYFALNYTNPVSGPIFKQLYVRQAMQLLMNQTLWIQLFSAGYGAPTYGPVPVFPPTDLTTKVESSNPYPYNPTKAKKLLSSHGWTVAPNGITTCTKPGTGSNECGAGIAQRAAMNFNYLYMSGAVSFTSMVQELQTSWEQAGIHLTLVGKSFNLVISAAATPCTAGKACPWDIANSGGGWIYSPDSYPTGEEIFATGSGSDFGEYSSPKADKLIALTNTSSSLTAMYNYENYLAKQVPDIWQPETALQFNEVAKNVCGFAPENPLFSWVPENWHFCKSVKG